jgi:hypothetical protein
VRQLVQQDELHLARVSPLDALSGRRITGRSQPISAGPPTCGDIQSATGRRILQLRAQPGQRRGPLRRHRQQAAPRQPPHPEPSAQQAQREEEHAHAHPTASPGTSGSMATDVRRTSRAGASAAVLPRFGRRRFASASGIVRHPSPASFAAAGAVRAAPAIQAPVASGAAIISASAAHAAP